MEHPPNTTAPLLFYPGCYIYSPTTIRNTLKILDHIGTPYTVLGGVSYCCGLPHRFQGNQQEAKACTTRLQHAITTANPKIIVTACLECLEALHSIKQETNATYEILHILEYLHRYHTHFLHAHTKTPLILHTPCRLTTNPNLQKITEHLITNLGVTPQYLPPNTPHCCRHWHHGDPTNKDHHTKIITAATNINPRARLVCPCLTCLETIQKTTPDAPLTDLIDIYANTIKKKAVMKP
jgi:Fe-S oxidoreductase